MQEHTTQTEQKQYASSDRCDRSEIYGDLFETKQKYGSAMHRNVKLYNISGNYVV